MSLGNDRGKSNDVTHKPNDISLERLGKLVELAEEIGLYLDVTGLACYHKGNIPLWYDKLNEQDLS